MQLFAMKIAHGSSSCAPQPGQNPKNPLNLAKSKISYTIYKDGSNFLISNYFVCFSIHDLSQSLKWGSTSKYQNISQEKMILSKIWTDFLFFRKAPKPTSSEATHLFCRQTRIYCLSRKTIADKYIFLTEIHFHLALCLFSLFLNFWGERFEIWFCSTSTSLKGDCISNCCIWKRCWKDMILPRIWGEQRFRKNESEL